MPVTRGGYYPFDDLSRRWHVLAERRLAAFTEMYRSGRWRRYYRTEQQFAVRMLEVIQAAKIWAELAGHKPTPLAPDQPLPTAREDLPTAA
jgi:uncharacterized repeat protein (TIGR03809 family)